ncbi:MAG TPA: dicarboxylate/amino acid:cation symporter [Rhabdochlamydiaceae bacterium]|jgi:Na+/H+-dicarboxylate symporter|nr:dicarboxylate/amino acid:cation symporter [Rhabdochlamydiaceae bacterium]
MHKKSSLLIQVLIAIALAMLIGGFSSPDSELFGVQYIELFGFLGKLFLNGLTLLVVPLVGSSIVNGISQMGKDKSFGRLGAKTFFFYIFTTFLAVLTGLLFVNIIKPGTFMAGQAEGLAAPAIAAAPETHMQAVGQILLKLIPINIFEAASHGNMLGIIFFALLFGFALAKIESTASETVMNVIKGIFHTLMKMTHYLIRVMPLGVFFLVSKAIAVRGLGSIESLLYFFLTVLLGLVTFMFVILPLFMRIMGLSPWRHLRAMAPALVTAFSTSSSAATLPITMECVEKRAGVSNRICSFVVPLGTSINLSGSALYECIAVLFIAQVVGFEMTIVHQAIVVALSLLTSMGVAGIPSGSLVAILIILNAMGFPGEGLALILPVDRILDMCRTTVNVFSDASCAVMVAHTEGETVLASKRQ